MHDLLQEADHLALELVVGLKVLQGAMVALATVLRLPRGSQPRPEEAAPS